MHTKPEKPETKCEFYKTPAGGEPVREWLFKQSEDVRKKVGRDIAAVQFTWPNVGRLRVGTIGAGLFEVRSSVFDVDYRVLFSISAGKILLLHALQKSTNALPQADVDLATARKRETDKDVAERRRKRK
jgi:phage-related protein